MWRVACETALAEPGPRAGPMRPFQGLMRESGPCPGEAPWM